MSMSIYTRLYYREMMRIHDDRNLVLNRTYLGNLFDYCVLHMLANKIELNLLEL